MRFRAFRAIRSHAWAATALLVLLSAAIACARAALPEALARVKPSVVAVGTFEKLRNPSFVFRGTGFAVEDGTLIATNANVVPEALRRRARR